MTAKRKMSALKTLDTKAPSDKRKSPAKKATVAKTKTTKGKADAKLPTKKAVTLSKPRRVTPTERMEEFAERHSEWEVKQYAAALEREQVRVGRPTLYHPDLCPQVIALGSLGRGKTEIAFEIGVSLGTLRNWYDRYPEFGEALDRAHEAAVCYFMQCGRLGMNAGKDFNGGVWEFLAKTTVPDALCDKKGSDATSKGQQIIQMIITPEEAAL